MLERAQKAAEGVGRLRRRSAAIVCNVLDLDKDDEEKAYTCPVDVSNITAVHSVRFQNIQQ